MNAIRIREPDLPLPVLDRIDRTCDRFEAAWKAGQRPRIEDYLEEFGDPERAVCLRQLLVLEWDYRQRQGESPRLDEYLVRFPGAKAVVREAFANPAARDGCDGSTHSTARAQAPPAGVERLGEYELLGRLGAGGMGVVYQARQVFLNRLVALKILPAERTANRRAVERFLHEMGVVGQLSHPNVVVAYDAREVAGTYFLAMEYVPGVDLYTLVRRIGPLPVPEACELARQAALGLQYIHEHHLVHRDIKPSNLMVTPAGVVKVLDLGLALLAEDRPAGEHVTSAGQVLGTTDYMAPEQVSDAHQVDHRADLYSLGCTLYRLLAGRAPFGHPQYEDPLRKLLAHLNEAAPPVRQFRPEIPPALAEITDRLLAKQPSDRLASAAEVAAALQPFTAGSDLPGLLARGGQVSPSQRDTDQSLTSTADRLSSPRVETGTTLSAVARPRKRVWSSRRLRLAAGGLALVVFLAAVVGIFRVVTDYGTLEFQTSDRDVRVVVQQGGEQVDVVDLNTRLSIRLRSGEYQLQLAEGSRAELDRDTILLFRGTREVVAMRRLSQPARRPEAGSSPHTTPKGQSTGAPEEYFLVELKYPDDKAPTGAMGLNNRGDVVGYYRFREVGNQYQKGFLFSQGKFRQIDVGVGQVIPRAINDAGQIVFRGPRALLLADGRVTDIGNGSAEDINQAGDVVGNLGADAFLYRAGKVQKLDKLPNTHLAMATAISDGGHIVGWYRNESGGPNHAFVYVDGVMKRLPEQEGLIPCTADDVNANGQVVGTCQTCKDGSARIFLYEKGVARLLPPFGRWSVSRAMNSSGEVVGDWSPDEGGRVIFVAKPSRLLSIPIPSWTDCLPLDINNLGQITGYGCRGDGKQSAFLLTPKHLRIELEKQHGAEVLHEALMVTAREVEVNVGRAATAKAPSTSLTEAKSAPETKPPTPLTKPSAAQAKPQTTPRVPQPAPKKLDSRTSATGDLVPGYTLTEILPESGWYGIEPSGINGTAEIVGRLFQQKPSVTKAFHWACGEFRTLDLPTPRGDHECAQAINNAGQIIGTCRWKGADRAFIFASGNLQTVGVLSEYRQTLGKAINRLGVGVGVANETAGDRAVVFVGGHVMVLPTLAQYSIAGAHAINDRGQIVGLAYCPVKGMHACRWVDGNVYDLGTLSGHKDSQAYDINNEGQVVGCSWPSHFTKPDGHAVVWEGQTIRDLGTLGGENSCAIAINDDGTIVGASSICDSPSLHAFLHSDGRMLEIHPRGWRSSTARDINGLGQIVGDGERADGRWCAFLLTPKDMPERLKKGTETSLEALVRTAASATVTGYQLRILSGLSGTDNTQASDINNRGDIVGTAWPSGFESLRGGWLLRDNKIEVVVPLGGRCSQLALNNHGVICGNCAEGSELVGFVWEHGTKKNLGKLTPDNDITQPRAINDTGVIVGRAYRANHGGCAVVFDGASPRALGSLPGGEQGDAVALNAQGHVTGWSSTGNAQHAFLYRVGVMIDLGALPGDTTSFGHAINSRDQVVGASHPPKSSRVRGFVYGPAGMRDLGTLGGETCNPSAINDKEEIVGCSQDAKGELHAFLYRDGKMTDLHPAGWVDSRASDINDAGQIVGYGKVAVEAPWFSFLLTPVERSAPSATADSPR